MKGPVQIVAVWLAALLVVLAGCAPSPTPTVVPASPSPSPSPLPAPTATRSSTQPLVVTLRLWVPEELSPYGDGAAAALLAERLAEFSRTHSDVQVEVLVKKAHGRGGLLDLLRTASVAAPSVLPDLIVLDATDLRLAAQTDLLQPLGDHLSTDLVAELFPFALVGSEDQTAGVMIAAELEHLAYRTTLFATPPLTWTAILSAGVPFVFPAGRVSGGVNDSLLAQYLAAGGGVEDAQGNPGLQQDTLVALLTFYEQGVATGVISPAMVLDITDTSGCWERLQTGEAGVAVVSSQDYWSAGESDLAPAPLPTRDGKAVTLARGWAVGLVTPDPDRQRLAVTLLEWLLEPEHSNPWTRALGYLPTTSSSLQGWATRGEEQAMLEMLLQAATLPPEPAVRAAVGPPLQAAVEAVLLGQRAPAEAAAAATLR
jgi:ABC-type glycerol-3-phosphate transport system substrate-binding protein